MQGVCHPLGGGGLERSPRSPPAAGRRTDSTTCCHSPAHSRHSAPQDRALRVRAAAPRSPPRRGWVPRGSTASCRVTAGATCRGKRSHKRLETLNLLASHKARERRPPAEDAAQHTAPVEQQTAVFRADLITLLTDRRKQS